MRLCTGNKRLNAHMLRKTKLAHHHQPAAAVLTEDQRAERNNTAEMPAPADSKTKRVANSSPHKHIKFYSSKEELETTATFILQTALSV